MMKNFLLPLIIIIVIVVMLMGCNEKSKNEPPTASLSLEPDKAWIYDNETLVESPEITFNASKSNDPDGTIRNYHYDFGEGDFSDLSQNTTNRDYSNGGDYMTKLTVSDDDGSQNSESRELFINYQYSRVGQVLEGVISTASQDHNFPISIFNPKSGVVYINVTVTDVSTPSVNITVYNSTGEVVKNEKKESVGESTNITITLSKDDYQTYKFGEWVVRVECENGDIEYDIVVQVKYDE